MAFPIIAAVNGGNNNSNGTSHTVNLPAGIQSGNLLIVAFVADGKPVITFPEGWTEMFQTVNGSKVAFGAWYRIADGGEGTTIIVGTSVSERSAHTSYRITNYSGTPEVTTSTIGMSSFPDPPSLSPSWGARDTLWLACQGSDNQEAISSYPTNYTDGRQDVAASPFGCNVGTARRELNLASEDPSTFTMTHDEEWVANTIAIQPTMGAAYHHGLKVQGEAAELALCDVGNNPLRFRKGGTTYGIEVVETNDPNASRVRIKTPAGIKAIRRYT